MSELPSNEELSHMMREQLGHQLERTVELSKMVERAQRIMNSLAANLDMPDTARQQIAEFIKDSNQIVVKE
jgi:hypothetical protein